MKLSSMLNLLFLAFTIMNVAQGNEVLWLRLKTLFSYRDLTKLCSNKYNPTSLFFGAEVDKSEIIQAVFQDSLNTSTNKIILNSQEIQQLLLHRDKNGQLWLKTASIQGRLLNWMFFTAGGGAFSTCKPSQVIASVEPDAFKFEFDVKDPIEESESNLAKFRGRLKDGAAYEIELQFLQQPQQDEVEIVLGESVQNMTMNDSVITSYPNPPWTRHITAMGNSNSKSSAQLLCQSDARAKLRTLERTCRSHFGYPSSHPANCFICNQIGSQWQCSETVQIRCR